MQATKTRCLGITLASFTACALHDTIDKSEASHALSAMFHHSFFVGALAFMVSSASSVSASSLEEAYETCKHGSSEERIVSCGQVIDQARDRAVLLRAYNTHGLALCDLDRCEEAVGDFDHVIRINPKIAGYFDNRARALRAAKRFSEAIADSNHAIAMAPTYAFVYLGKAHAFEDQERYGEALAVVDVAMSVEVANAGVYEYRGKLLGDLKRYDEAYVAFEHAMALQPERPSVFKTRADVELAEGKLQKALEDYQRYPSDGNDAAEVVSSIDHVRSTIAETEAQRRYEADRQAQVERDAEAERQTELARQVAASQQAELRQQLDAARRDAEMARREAAEAKARPVAVVALVDPAAQAAKPSQPAESISKDEASKLNKSLGELQAQVKALQGALMEQKRLKSDAGGDVETIDATIVLVEKQIAARQSEYDVGEARFSRYLTSVRPQDRDEYATARAASQAFPRVPYFIPGTSETGEFWIEPTVSETGALTYQFRFVDPLADYSKVRDTIAMAPSEIADVQAALTKIRGWSLKAHEAQIRRVYTKRAACFPQPECPPDGETIDGKASTEIRFNVYEDGSTAGRIQRNKGRFVEGYNVSTDSALLLGAYIAYARRVAEREFTQGTQSKTDLDKLFR